MFDFVFGYVIVLFEMLVFKIFVDILAKRKSENPKSASLIYSLLSILVFATAILAGEYIVVKICLIVLWYYIALRCYTRDTRRKCILLCVAYQGLLLVTDYVTLLVESIFHINVDAQVGIAGVLLVILDKSILFLFVMILRGAYRQQEFAQLEDKDWVKFIFIPLFTIGMIIAMLSDDVFAVSAKLDELFIVIALGLVAMNVVMFFLLKDILVRERIAREQQICLIEARNQQKVYESLTESVEIQRRLSHEYKNQLGVLQGLLERNELQQMKRYLSSIQGEVQHDIDCIDTHHAIVNVILNQKYQEATHKHILFQCKINDLSGLHMEEKDVATLVSNLLNNAIEACEKVEDKPYIKFKMILKEHKMVLSVCNSCISRGQQDGWQHTSKEEDVELHGYGLKNVQRIVENYQGEMVIHGTKQEFKVSIVIQFEH